MKVVFYNKLNRAWMDNIEALSKEFPYTRFVTEKEGMDGKIEDADAIVGGELPLHVIQRAKNLKIIFVPYAGIKPNDLAGDPCPDIDLSTDLRTDNPGGQDRSGCKITAHHLGDAAVRKLLSRGLTGAC